MADINIGSDQLLTTTLNDNDRLTFTRIETGQQIATMTVGDFKKAIVIDFSSLTEQKIPGEFWVDADGTTKRQVYQRTFIGTTNSAAGGFSVLTSGVKAFNVECSNVFGGTSSFPIAFVNYSGGTFGRDYLYQIYNSTGTIILAMYGETVTNRPYVITLKYTKA